jgi:hypothetical protein
MKPGEALVRLAARRPELGLDISPAGAELPRLAETVRGAAFDDWLAGTASLAEGTDPKTAAAYLISILTWRLGEIFGALYLEGTDLPALTADDLGATLTVVGAPDARDIRFGFHIGAAGGGSAFDRAGMKGSILAVHRPLVAALNRRTGLSQGALWRLVTDGMTNGFLVHGKLTGGVDFARAEAEAIFGGGSPLANRQWRFVRVAPENHAPEWFRLRGGCCRLYRTQGGGYCTTCVLRDEAEQVARLETFMRNRAH